MLRLQNISKSFNQHLVNDKISFEVEEGDFFFLLGPSGCGKSTLLKIIAGLLDQEGGNLFLNGEDITSFPPNRRNLNTVFQNFALFPHLNVFDNIAFGLKLKKVKKDEIKKRVHEVLNLVQLNNYESKNIETLSGGQKQRVAIARAIVNKPTVLLLDEPLSALDIKLRKNMQIELRNLQKQLNITFVYVTHNQEEALTMGDKIAIMNKGRIEQIGSPYEIYYEPKTKFVASFIGEINLFNVLSYKSKKNKTTFNTSGGFMILINSIIESPEMIRFLGLRPEYLSLSSKNEDSQDNSVQGIICEKLFQGNNTKYFVKISENHVLQVIKQHTSITGSFGLNEVVTVSWKEEHITFLHR
jgi:spermidine/putrescine transport system ATP-binding protein